MDAFATLALVGPSAYFCLLDIGAPKAGETVVVSTAAGAVGSIAGQIAKIKGCHVVGLTGSDEKCRWIKEELGFDEAINYKTANLPDALSKSCPNGIDVYFDNVGGTILDECLKLMNLYGRIPTCGLISQYNALEPVPGPYNYSLILMHRLKIQGFIILDYLERFPEANESILKWMSEGKIKVRLDVSEGLETALDVVKKLYTGENNGKLMVRVKEI
jgi:NADPH-dependent curcumin reductase CurA